MLNINLEMDDDMMGNMTKVLGRNIAVRMQACGLVQVVATLMNRQGELTKP
jgi:hypothetical protein